MPPFDKELENHNPLAMRILAYGEEKTRKTWWAGRAAESGFNVILLDCDDGAHILINGIDKAARERITHVNIFDEIDRPVACEFVTRMLSGRPFLWDEVGKIRVPIPASRTVEHSFYHVDISKLTLNDVVVCDSWTKLVRSLSLRWYLENKIDISDLDRANEAERHAHRGMYGWTGELATWMLKQFKTLSCHIVVIGHKTVYEKRTQEIAQGGRVVEKIEWTRTQPVSTSGPHGMYIGSDFSEILYFYSLMAMFKIDTSRETFRTGGCRLIPPGSYKWEDLQFVDICKIAGSPMPDGSGQAAFKWYPPNSAMPDDVIDKQTVTGGIIPANNPVQGTSFAKLLAK